MIFKLLKNLVLSLIGLFFLLVILLYFHNQSHAPVTIEEVIPANEPQQIQRATDNFINIIKETQTTYAARGAHAKGHACVKAYFDINNDIDSQLQYGIFKTPGKRYKSWIRFSNGSSNMAKSDDGAKDSRGMAIKLLKVESSSNHTQEFLAHNSPAFFSVDLEDYNNLVESENKIKYFLSGYNPFNWRLRELSHVNDTLAPPPYSPIWDEYFSNTAYKLGPHNIKFMMRSCSESLQTENDISDPDFLKNTLVKELSLDSACMQFLVQLQDVSKLMPIEDPSVLWKENDSPFIPVAKITIPAQQFDTPEQQQFCENLSFSPWNSLDAHRPIGALNRVRKIVYQASSDFRHSINQTSSPQNIDFSIIHR
ncbi:MAG: catalase family protein [Piscirickettsiaceae bacterium]|nr:catalase family protein [Piscirickettsiaceae bacterium]